MEKNAIIIIMHNQKIAEFWHKEQNLIICDLCPRACTLKDGQTGFCLNRQNLNGELISITYGRVSSFHLDPIEKKPLFHFFPHSSVFSFGTIGCNLDCQFCQNWQISKDNKNLEREYIPPEQIIATAKKINSMSVAFTYNEPIIFFEYLKDVADLAKAQGIYRVGVSAGYITEKARPAFFNCLDAVNIDLKGFSEDFYSKYCHIHLEPVLETIKYVKNETKTWLEVTNLIIPNANDTEEDFEKLTTWFMENLGPDVPLHFSAFYPSYKMMNTPPTPPETLIKARDIALKNGLHYVYTGNIADTKSQSTFCPNCKKIVIERNQYNIGSINLNGNKCKFCSTEIAGRF